MGKTLNYEQAIQFLYGIEDPVVQALIQHAYSKMFTENLPPCEGEFDLLFYFRAMEAFLRDRERLAQALTGQTDHDRLVGEDGW